MSAILDSFLLVTSFLVPFQNKNPKCVQFCSRLSPICTNFVLVMLNVGQNLTIKVIGP